MVVYIGFPIFSHFFQCLHCLPEKTQFFEKLDEFGKKPRNWAKTLNEQVAAGRYTQAGFIYFAANRDNAVNHILITGIVLNSILTAFDFVNVPNSDITII